MSEKINVVKQWIESGDHDLGTAQVTFLYLPSYRDTITFHCQQAAEKYLKGFLLFLETPFQKKHSLNYLLGLISSKIEIPEDIYENATLLEDFAVEVRYPDTSIDLLDIDIQQSIDIAKLIRKFTLSCMDFTVDYTDIEKE